MEKAMSYEAIERVKAQEKLVDIEQAVKNFPGSKDYVLDEFTLLDVIKMARFADMDTDLQFTNTPRGEFQDAWFGN